MSLSKKSFKKDDARIMPSNTDGLLSWAGITTGIFSIILATVIAYWPSLNGGYILDDEGLLKNNRLILASDGLYRFWSTKEAIDYWPVTNTTLWIEWRLWGDHPVGYHAGNLMLHIVEALLIWIILRKMSIPGAFLAAMLFAVHPVNVESVAWISQRKNMMAMLFLLLSILWYLKFLKRTRLRLAAKLYAVHCPLSTVHFSFWYWLSLAAFVLAMLSKGSVAVLPILLLGIIWWQREITKRDFVRLIPFFTVAVILTLVNIWFQSHGKDVEMREADFIERLLGAGGVVWFYLYKALLPLKLIFIYPQWRISNDLWWWLPLLAVLAVTIVLWRYRKSWSRPILFAWGFFCVSLAPVLGFIDVGFMRHSLVADHYQHIAIIGVIALLAAGWGLWRQCPGRLNPLAANVAAIAAVVFLTVLTTRQNGLYRDAITLYQATLKNNPQCSLIYNNLGTALDHAGRLNEAIDCMQKAISIRPDYYRAHNNLGLVLMKEGKVQQAIEQFEQSLSYNPDFADALNNLGNILIRQGRPQEAIKHLQKAVLFDPELAEAHYNLANAFMQVGEARKAKDQYVQALRLRPDYSEVHNNLGIVLANEGRLSEAIDHYKQALLGHPKYVDALINLGNALMKAERYDEAIEYYNKVLQYKPDFAEARFNVSICYAKLGRSDEAITTARQALGIARSTGKTALAKQIEDWLNAR
jgi:protein O-mannosyl-transferase